MRCPGCGDEVPVEIAYRDGPVPFHWNDEGGGHTMRPAAYDTPTAETVTHSITFQRTELIPGGRGAMLAYSDDFPDKQFLIVPNREGVSGA